MRTRKYSGRLELTWTNPAAIVRARTGHARLNPVRLGRPKTSEDRRGSCVPRCLHPRQVLDVILPMTVPRRLDAVYELTRQAVLDMRPALEAIGLVDRKAAFSRTWRNLVDADAWLE